MIFSFWGPPHGGKTTLAVETALTLGAQGKTVLITSAEDFCEQGLRMGRVLPAENSIVEVMQNPSGVRSHAQAVTDNVFHVGPTMSDTAFNLQFPEDQVKDFLDAADSVYDYVLVDCTTQKENVLTAIAIQKAKKIFIPIPARSCALAWLKSNKRVLDIIGRKSVYIANETVRAFDFAQMFKGLPEIKVDYTLAYVEEMPLMENEGRTIARGEGKSRQAKKFLSELRALVENER